MGELWLACLFVLLRTEKDLNPKGAASVKKTVRWTVFSEAGAKAGTENKVFGRQAVKGCEAKLYPTFSANF